MSWDLNVLLSQVDFLMPFPPHLGGCEHPAGAAHVPKCCLTSAVRTTTRDTGYTRNSTTCQSMCQSYILSTNAVLKPDLFPKTRLMFDGRPSRSQHRAVSCSLPYRRERSYECLAIALTPISMAFSVLHDIRANWRSEDGRQGNGVWQPRPLAGGN